MKTKTITAALAILAFIGIAHASTAPKIQALDSCNARLSAEVKKASITVQGHCTSVYAEIVK